MSRRILALMMGLSSFAAFSLQAQTLFRQNSGTTETLYTISMMDSLNGIAGGSRQALAVTTNGGERWTANQLFGQENYYASYFNDTSSGAYGGSHGFLFCKRPGRGPSQIVLPERKDIHSITMPTSDTVGNPRDLLCVGDTGLIYQSRDSGKTWAKVAPPARMARRNFYSTTYWDDSTWWIIGAGGIILYTETAGARWDTISSGTQKDLYSIAFPDDGKNGWIVGDQTLLYTTDYGDTWISIPTTATLRFVDGYDSTGFAVGDNGTLLATNDLVHWIPIETGAKANLYGIAITDNIYIVGDSGVILTSFIPQEAVGANAAHAKIDLFCDGRSVWTNTSVEKPMSVHIYDLLGVERAQLVLQGERAALPHPLSIGSYLYRTSAGMTGKFMVP